VRGIKYQSYYTGKNTACQKMPLYTGTRDGFAGTLKPKMKQKKLDKHDTNNYNYYEKALGAISETV